MEWTKEGVEKKLEEAQAQALYFEEQAREQWRIVNQMRENLKINIGFFVGEECFYEEKPFKITKYVKYGRPELSGVFRKKDGTWSDSVRKVHHKHLLTKQS